MTKDMVPVLYHDWTVTETGLDIPVSSITLQQFQNLSKSSKSRTHSNGSQPSSPSPEQPRQFSGTPPPGSSGLEVPLTRPDLVRRTSHNSGLGSLNDTMPRLVRSNSLGAMSRMKALSEAAEPANPSAKMKGNGMGTIQAPFATLKDAFEVMRAQNVIPLTL